MSSFSVGQSIQELIGTYRDNIHKFIVYTQLKLSFINVERLWVHKPDDLRDAGTNAMGVHSNIEHMM